MIKIRTNIPVIMAALLISFFITGSAADTIPASDNTVIASSSVSNMQSVAYESKLRSSLVGETGSPGEVHYSVSISGVNGSAEGGAVGTARTRFVVTSLEGRDTLLNASSEREWRDSTEVTGTIVNFRKTFDYGSGIRL